MTPMLQRTGTLLAAVALTVAGAGCSTDSTGAHGAPERATTTTTIPFSRSVVSAQHALDAAPDATCDLVAVNRAAGALGRPRTTDEVHRATALTVDYFTRLGAAASKDFPAESAVVTDAATAYGKAMADAHDDVATFETTTWATEAFQRAYQTIAASCPAAPTR